MGARPRLPGWATLAAGVLLALAGAGFSVGTARRPVGPVPAGFRPASVSFPSASRGFVLGVAPCARSPCTSLVGTSDGGRVWAGLRAPPVPLAVSAGSAAPAAVSEVVFADQADGWAFGPGLWSTHDGAAGFADAAVASCSPAGPRCSSPILRVERTPVGSDAWRPLPRLAGYASVLLALHGREGWVGLGSRRPFSAPTSIWRTTDAGASWSRLPDRCYRPAQAVDLARLASPGGSLLVELCAGNPGAGSEAKQVLVSSDGGATVVPAGRLPLPGLVDGFAAASAQNLVVAARSGASWLYRSSDGGRTWATARTLADGGVGVHDLAFVTPAEGVAVDGRPGQAGFPDRLLISRDGGATWSTVAIRGGGPGPAGAPAWPAVVRRAMADVAGRTQMPLEAPHSLPAGAANSATATGSADRYAVRLFHCPRPRPLNSPGIGTGACGGLASVYAGFGGRSYSSLAAAARAVDRDAGVRPAAGCGRTRTVALTGAVAATLYAGRYGGCEAVWHQRGWAFLLEGDLNGGVGGDRTIAWTRLARGEIAFLAAHPLAAAQGTFDCDLAADGLHTLVAFRSGVDVYTVDDYHSDLGALAIASAMGRYPRR